MHDLMKTLCLILSCLLGFAAVSAQPLQRVAPEQVGMDSQRLLWADEAINQAIAQKEIPGAVLAVVRHGKMAYLKAYGNKSLVPKVEPMTTATVFDMASCSKSMSTAICVMILAEQGKLRMLDPVNLYLPDFQNWQSEDGKETQVIRIQDLMTHTSGLPPYADVQKLSKEHGILNPGALMEYIATCPRDFRPQTDFQYSCLNFITLQHIVETVSGQSLRDFAHEHIFDVLGMKHTDYLPCTQDKKGNNIDKLACSEFWKAKDSYRQLQDAFYKYMVENGFDLQRGLPKEETNRQHYSVEEYKKITNFKQTKEILRNMKLELPDIPDIADINVNRLSKKRDEKILEEIIKPKDNVIQNLYQDNMNLHRQLSRQAQIIEEAEKYQKERDDIIADNEKLHDEVDNIKTEYNKKEFDLERKYTNRINKLEKENNFLRKVVDRFKETMDRFITWICKKFDMGA